MQSNDGSDILAEAETARGSKYSSRQEELTEQLVGSTSSGTPAWKVRNEEARRRYCLEMSLQSYNVGSHLDSASVVRRAKTFEEFIKGESA